MEILKPNIINRLDLNKTKKQYQFRHATNADKKFVLGDVGFVSLALTRLSKCL